MHTLPADEVGVMLPDSPQTGPAAVLEASTDLCGRLLGARYDVAELLSHGERGAVYLAHDRNYGRMVALRLTAPTAVPAGGEDVRVRARRRMGVRHAHLAAVQGEGLTEGGLHYVAMEYVPGRNLHHMLGDPRLAWPAAHAIGVQAAEALVALHGAWVIHGDVHPGNLVWQDDAERPLIKLVDLDVTGGVDAPAAGDGYLPPGFAGAERDPGSDVYALVATLYELCTGKLPDPQVDGLADRPEIPAWFADLLRGVLRAGSGIPSARALLASLRQGGGQGAPGVGEPAAVIPPLVAPAPVGVPAAASGPMPAAPVMVRPAASGPMPAAPVMVRPAFSGPLPAAPVVVPPAYSGPMAAAPVVVPPQYSGPMAAAPVVVPPQYSAPVPVARARSEGVPAASTTSPSLLGAVPAASLSGPVPAALGPFLSGPMGAAVFVPAGTAAEPATSPATDAATEDELWFAAVAEFDPLERLEQMAAEAERAATDAEAPASPEPVVEDPRDAELEPPPEFRGAGDGEHDAPAMVTMRAAFDPRPTPTFEAATPAIASTSPQDEVTPAIASASPAIEAAPIVSASPAIEAAAIVSASPAIEAAPVVSASPAIEAAPVVSASPAIEAAPIVSMVADNATFTRGDLAVLASGRRRGWVLAAAVAALGVLVIVWQLARGPEAPAVAVQAPAPAVASPPTEPVRAVTPPREPPKPAAVQAAAEAFPPVPASESAAPVDVPAEPIAEDAAPADAGAPAASEGKREQLSANEFRQIMLKSNRSPAVEACYFRHTAGVEQKIEVVVRIGPRGQIQKLRMEAGPLGDCLRDVISKIDFPSAERSAQHQFVFRTPIAG